MNTNQPEANKKIFVIDHNFLGITGAIASYLIPHSGGAALIEAGPGSTINHLSQGLADQGYSPSDITDVFLTHIHLDHAGAAGWLAGLGARIHIHHIGAPHLVDPGKLLASAARIYGDQMDVLWGEFLPVPSRMVNELADGDIIQVNELQFRAIDTPGHANHHHVYIFEDVCFSGDINGIRMHGLQHIRLPMPPPEFNLELWRESQAKLNSEFVNGAYKRIALTHFGIFEDTGWHLNEIRTALDEVELWIEQVLPGQPSLDELNELFLEWTRTRSLEQGLDPQQLDPYEVANPSWMSTYGIERYWRKNLAKKR
jgi:glyoxylase-like metal-dependent hydrolase (beta-lactamase superfamily II)